MKTVNVENIEKRIDWINSILKNDSFKKYTLPAQLKALRFESDCLCKLLLLMENKNESPNPVDGDVQALIADCQAEIAELEKSLTTWGDVWIPYLQSKLNRQQVALAALTAQPVAILDVQNSREEDKFAMVYTRVGHTLVDDTYTLYTTPPAQLLRPVELPNLLQPGADGYDDWYMHSSEDGEYMKADDVIAALENAGVPYEVKS